MILGIIKKEKILLIELWYYNYNQYFNVIDINMCFKINEMWYIGFFFKFLLV